MVTALAYIVLGLFALWALTLLALALGFALSGSRGEESGTDDVMAVADAVAEGDGDFYDTDDDLRQNFEADEWGVFERNWMPLTDPQRALLHKQFDAIVEGADR